MPDPAILTVGWYTNWFYEDIDSELIVAFRDEMRRVRCALRGAYAGDLMFEGAPDDLIDVIELHAPAGVIAERLDLLGIDAQTACTSFDERLRAYRSEMLGRGKSAEVTALTDLDSRGWLARVSAQGCSAQDHERSRDPTRRSWEDWTAAEPGSLPWLRGLIQLAINPVHELRLAVTVMPDDDVTLDLTGTGWCWRRDDDRRCASAAMQDLRERGSAYAPIVVLTEGRTDAHFLSAALTLLYPHLTDLVSFLDYDHKAEGGAGALVRMVKSFAAAGIANRVVALFDNDTAAADALRALDTSKLPNHVRVLRYPDTSLAAAYPTVGPPTLDAPHGTLAYADVNGLAGSIELYLGRDVLTLPDGHLRPVRWRSLVAGSRAYQGEVTDKHEIHQAFREKVALARRDPSSLKRQDWEDLRAVLQQIITAFRP